MYISSFFNIDEVIRSSTASRLKIDNMPPDELLGNIKWCAKNMDMLRTILGTPVHVDSWYRCIQLNRVLGSKDTSDHVLGLAVDFISPMFGTPVDICKYLLQYRDVLAWKQLILEHTWVHISFPVQGMEAKKQVLSLLDNGGYALGLTDSSGYSLTA